MKDFTIDSMGTLASFSDDYDDKCTLHVTSEGEVWVGTDESPMMLTAKHARELGAMLITAVNTGKIQEVIKAHKVEPENPNLFHAIALMKRLNALQLETIINIMNMVLIAQDGGHKPDGM